MSSLAFLRALLAPLPAVRVGSAPALRARLGATLPDDTVERAAIAAIAAADLGWAFACGYEAALARLDPAAVAGGKLAALCASEEGGAHPRAIRTALALRAGGGLALSGQKSWITLGPDADVLLVVASTGADEQGRNRLRVARVASSRPGVRIEPTPALPFAPTVAHARVTFDDVAVAEEDVLPGDGYDAVLKPFRTLEDTHVLAAALGWAIAVARAAGWDRAWIGEAIAFVVLLRSIAASPPLAPETHVALDGALRGARRLLEGAPWPTAEATACESWERDRALLDVASKARAARFEAAWRAIGPIDDR